MKRFFWKVSFLLLVLVLISGASIFYAVAYHPFQDSNKPQTLILIPTGSSSTTIASKLTETSTDLPFWLVKWTTRLFSERATLKAGAYALDGSETLWEVLEKIAKGDVVLDSITFVEGWTAQQFLQEIAKSSTIIHTLDGLSETEIAQKIGVKSPYLEGWLFPDTYKFSPGTKDIDLLKQSFAMMQKALANAWKARSPHAQVKTPYEALILASIIEKETGLASDRPTIGGVFNNRLKIGMLLQTDPTVIYGMKERFRGNIRRSDLEDRSNRWNTYVIQGLPPSPIASPGKESLNAALQPEQHGYFYFVAKGENGASAFAATLEQHNRNVRQYILKR